MGYQTTWTYYAPSFEVPVPSFGRIVGHTEAILRESTSASPVNWEQLCVAKVVWLFTVQSA